MLFKDLISEKKLINIFRKITFSVYFTFLKIKKTMKLIYKLISIIQSKTIPIEKLIINNEVISRNIFEGSTYSLKQKLDINNNKFKYLPEGVYDVPEYNIYKINRGIIKAGTNNIYSKDGRRITGIDFQELSFEFSIISKIKNINIKFLDGILLILGVGEIEKNYSHAWTEFAARAYATKVADLEYDYILIDSCNAFSKEILKLLNFSEEKIIYSENYQYIKARKLIYPELINNFKEYFLNGINVYHRKYLPIWINYLYDEISENVSSFSHDCNFEKIYISRKNKNERAVVNEKDLILNLKKLGFKVVYFEDYSITDQIRIMKASKQIVGLHGAGLVNINFCKAGTKILELFPHNYQCAFFYMHAEMCNLKYDFYIGEPVQSIWRKSPIMENFYVDLKKINDFLLKNWS